MRRVVAFSTVALALLAIVAATGCSKESPTMPAPPAARASVSISSISVVGARNADGGYGYRVVVHLRESGGVSALIKSIDLTFMDGANVVTTSRFDQTIPATGNVTPANGVADTRELVTTDTTVSHPYAASVVAKVTYTDLTPSTTVESTVTGSAAVPALNEPPPPTTYTLRGIITEQGTDRGIEGARVEALNGTNAGKATLTDAAGAYTLTGLVAETFRMRASATGFDYGEQNVTVPDIARADLALKRTAPAACAYAVTPNGTVDVPFVGGQLALTISRTSGSCTWQVSTNVSWITPGGSSGSGDAALTVSYQSNALFVGRVGVVTIEWSGGSTQLTIRQAAESPAFCRNVAVTVNGQNPLTIPAAGGTYTANLVPEAGTPPGACGNWSASGTNITVNPPANGPTPGAINFTVQPNASTSPRVLFLNISIFGGPSITLTINQSGS